MRDDLPPWRAVLYDGHSVRLAEQAETFFRVAVEPACAATASELSANPRAGDDDAIGRHDQLLEAQLELHRSFALALGGMWERHFRRHLAHSASTILPGDDKTLSDAENGIWPDMLKAFAKVRGFQLAEFEAFDQLSLLHRVASAVRHGNGRTARELYDDHPDLFSHEPIRSWFSYFTQGGEPDYSIHRLAISFEQLVAFHEAVVSFWRDVRRLQANGI